MPKEETTQPKETNMPTRRAEVTVDKEGRVIDGQTIPLKVSKP